MRRISANDERLPYLLGESGQWWDVELGRIVSSAIVYIAYGCPDWGDNKQRQRNSTCVFCALSGAVAAYREMFYQGGEIPEEHHRELFALALKVAAQSSPDTLMIFNAGSFLAMPADLQTDVMREVVRYQSVRRVVIEARPILVTEERLAPLLHILQDRKLTIRLGIETKDDRLRNKVLRKGHSRREISRAVGLMRSLGVTSGGYVLLNPAPGLDRRWAIEETIETIDWMLSSANDGMGMGEVYLGPACVAPGTELERYWKDGTFAPIDLWAVLEVLKETTAHYPGRIHLLPFRDVPAFLAVPSNHVARGIPQSLETAHGCDLTFHDMFSSYRRTMDRGVLVEPDCDCRR